MVIMVLPLGKTLHNGHIFCYKIAFADQQEITDKELWQRLDELEREEEVYLAEEKQREEEEREKRGWREEEEEGESGWRPGREEMEEGSGRRWWEDEEEEEEDKEDERKNKASDIKLEKKFQISESAARASDDGGPLRIVVKHCSLIGTGARERSPDMEVRVLTSLQTSKIGTLKTLGSKYIIMGCLCIITADLHTVGK